MGIRQITVWSSHGVGSEITKEEEPMRTMNKVIQAAKKVFNSHPLELNEETAAKFPNFSFNSKLLLKLKNEIGLLEKLLTD